MTRQTAFLGQAEGCAAIGSPFTARLWPLSGRAKFHGRWIDWTAPPPEDARW